MMDRFFRFWYLTRCEKLFFFEAYFLLLISSISVKTVAFRYINSYLHRWNGRGRKAVEPSDNVKNEIKLINDSLSRAANALPWNSLCLSQSIAKLVMLRRRGIPAILFAGVRSLEDTSLCAHAWIHAGDSVFDENNRNETAEFTVLVRIGTETFRQSPGNLVSSAFPADLSEVK
jgi:Transglutaminase-like superfamily